MDEELFFFQEVGADWLSIKKVALLADEMGLGKSAQAITAADRAGYDKILVICPAAARVNWEREFRKFSKKIREFQRVETKSENIDLNKSVICSYDLAISNKDISGHNWDLLILDEAHFCKNMDAKRSKKIFGKEGLVRNAKNIWALTGTPAPNNIGELWIILYTFGVTTLKYDKFIDYFCIVEWGAYGPQIHGNKKNKIPELKAMLSRIMLRRKKVDVMKELPPIHFTEMEVEPGEVDPRFCSSFIQYFLPKDRRDELVAKVKSEEALITAAIDSFEQNVGRSLPVLEALAGSVSTLRRYNGISKVPAAVELIKAELDAGAYEKVVVFAIHIDVIETMREALKSYGVVTLYGATDPKRRQRNIDKFQNEKKTRIFIGNIAAAGTAITLTAAHNVIFVEQDWVPANNAQAAMRCHRIGQTNPVFVRFLGVAGSIDARVSQILRRKVKNLLEVFD